MPLRVPQTQVRSQLGHCRLATGLTQEEVAWATGIPIATYIRLERGQYKNPRLGWLVNAALVVEATLEDLIEERMLEWHMFGRPTPPSQDWYERPEVLARMERWAEVHG